MQRIVLPVAILACALGGRAAAQAPPLKAEIVSVTGCLKEEGAGNWMLANATDPTPSTANAPRPGSRPAPPVAGKNRFKLIGLAAFNLPPLRDQSVIVKGLLIKAAPVSRLNVTSVTMVSTSCVAPAGAPIS